MKNIIITAIILCAIVFACQKSDSIRNQSTKGKEISGVPLSSIEVENQLKWIAKGYARLFENSTKRTVWHDYLASKTYNEELHSESNPYFDTQDTFDFDNLVKNAVDTDFPNNNYIQSVYYGFDVNSCFFSTGLRQIDPDLNNLDYRITYVPFDNASQPIDSVWGFYINSTTNDVDSTLLTDDNYDDFDVYVVFVQNGCDIASQVPGSVCNGDEICEPQKGETPENCEACAKETQGPGEHTLEVLSVTIKEDKPMFDESWIENKYVLGWNWMITENNIGIITTNRKGVIEDEPYNVWKRKELVRCKKNGTKCRGTATSKGKKGGVSKMYNKFNPSLHSLLIHFFEKQSINGNFYNFTPKINGIGITFPSSLTATFDNSFDVWTNQSNGTFHTVQGSGNNGEGVIFVPGSSLWNFENINGQNYMVLIKTAPSHSGAEIEIKLGYKL